jgi:hypothetical protein
MSLTTTSNMPSGSHSSGEISAIVPVKLRGATPTTVKSMALTLIVLPSSSARSCRTMATGTRADGCSSARVNDRPAASGAPSASK